VPRSDLVVYDSYGNQVLECQISEAPSILINATDPYNLPYELFFLADIPALGYATYFVSVAKDTDIPVEVIERKFMEEDSQTIENDVYKLYFTSLGMLSQLEQKNLQIVTDFTQQFMIYQRYELLEILLEIL
jgi:hypothetical protein